MLFICGIIFKFIPNYMLLILLLIFAVKEPLFLTNPSIAIP